MGAWRKCEGKYCTQVRFPFSSFLERAEAVIRCGTKCCFSHGEGKCRTPPCWSEVERGHSSQMMGRVLSRGGTGEAAELWPAGAWLSLTKGPRLPAPSLSWNAAGQHLGVHLGCFYGLFH